MRFVGFYVAGADTELFNEATMVVMMRHGTTTVLSMQNDYKGPPEDFAMVVPVPVVLEEDDVRTLPHHVFSRIDQMAAPRLVEYWEQDPCQRRRPRRGRGGGRLRRIMSESSGGGGAPFPAPPVRIEAEFSVEEYEIVILSADDSTALDAWLRTNGYNIPEGAEAALRPYIEQEMKFFVAKVDTEKVKWEGMGRDRHAVLSPLRMFYDSESFSLPVRLGMLNSSGTQDLIVHILAEQQRYEVANMPNVTIPTNIVVRDSTRRSFGSFYAALFDRTIAESGAVVTEYSWQASSCDPCPGQRLTPEDFQAVGADQIDFASTPPPAQTYWQSEVEVLTDQLPSVLSEKLRLGDVLQQCHRESYNGQPSDTVSGRIRFRVDTTAAPPVAVDAATFPTEQESELRGCIDRRLAEVTLPEGRMFAGVAEYEARAAVPPDSNRLRNLVLTRLHYRYDRDDLADDLVFRPAPPISGGRGVPRGQEGEMRSEVHAASTNTFQGRYVILHPWAGAQRCEHPRRGRWGGPLRRLDRHPVAAARNLGHVRRGGVRLERSVVASTLPAIIPTPEVLEDYGRPTAERDIALPVQPPAPAATPRADVPPSDGCNCSSAPGGAAGLLLPLLALVAIPTHEVGSTRR